MKVSCIMPTADRRKFVTRAIGLFKRQDYADRELLIYDDGADSIFDLVPKNDARIIYLREEKKKNVGHKRNVLCDLAGSDVILHWDDDDWYSVDRISAQVKVLIDTAADITGLAQFFWITADETQAWKYSYPLDGRPWVTGSSFCYTKEFWKRVGFKDVYKSEDLYFVWADPFARIETIRNDRLFVATVHDHNTERKSVGGPLWKACPAAEVKRIMNEKAA